MQDVAPCVVLYGSGRENGKIRAMTNWDDNVKARLASIEVILKQAVICTESDDTEALEACLSAIEIDIQKIRKEVSDG